MMRSCIRSTIALWQGHATMIDEMAAAGPKPDAIVLAVGGGGLLCGVLEGLARNGWHDVPVVAAETEGADCYARSLAQGHGVELPAITSIATSLGAKRPCDAAVEWAARHEIHPVVVSDAEAVAASLRFLDEHRIVVGFRVRRRAGRARAASGRARVGEGDRRDRLRRRDGDRRADADAACDVAVGGRPAPAGLSWDGWVEVDVDDGYLCDRL